MINKNIIYNKNCIKGMLDLPDNSVQMILTDPPYLVNYKDRSGRSVANDMASNSDWLIPAFNEMYRVLENNRYAVVFYGWNEVDKFVNAWRKAGFRIIGHFVFYKKYASNARTVKKHMEYRHECAYLLAKGYPQSCEVLPSVMGWNYTGNEFHPTQKPVDLLLKLINAFCPTGGIVLDSFMGSASTALACIQSEIFDYLGYELDNNYFNIAMSRINEKSNKLRQVVSQESPKHKVIKPHYKYNLQNKKPESKNRRLPPPANDDYFINRAIKMQGVQNG